MKLELQHKHMVTEAVKAWIDEINPARSGNKLAEKSGVSSAYISKIRNGMYETENGTRTSPISDAHFHRLADAIGLRLDDQLHWDFIDSFKSIQKACRKAKSKSINMIIDGGTGMGKTYSLEHFAINNDYVLYVKATQNMSSKDLLESILDKLGVHHPIRGNHQKLEAIRRAILNRKGYLIIIDEVEVVRPGIYSVIKDIEDSIKRKSGFIICGMSLVRKLDTLALRDKAGFPQLRRRFFGNKLIIDKRLSQQAIVEACEYEGITNKSAQNVLSHDYAEIKDLDMLVQYIADIKDWQKEYGKKITGEEVIKLFSLNHLTKRAA